MVRASLHANTQTKFTFKNLRQMLRITFFLSLLVSMAFPLQAELTIVSAEHRDADSFKRFSEYLTGKHSDGRYSVFRSDSDSRDGFYVSLRADDKATLKQVSTVRLQFVPPSTQLITTIDFPADEFKKKRILVGLTGSDWLEENSRPVAWRIDLLDASQSVLESAQSFLWSEPVFTPDS